MSGDCKEESLLGIGYVAILSVAVDYKNCPPLLFSLNLFNSPMKLPTRPGTSKPYEILRLYLNDGVIGKDRMKLAIEHAIEY